MKQLLGSDAGGERATTMYSLLGTAKLNGLNPEKCLTHVLSVIADHPVNRIDELLPWNVNLYLSSSMAISLLRRYSPDACRSENRT